MTRGMKISLIVIMAVLTAAVLAYAALRITGRLLSRPQKVVMQNIIPREIIPRGRVFQQNPPKAQAIMTSLTITDTKKAVDAYLNKLGNSDLELKEIIVFQNSAYARVAEKSTGIGAFEVLVDSGTFQVIPEYGANMMWNLKYSHIAILGRRGMVNPRGETELDLPDPFTMAISADKALKIAQDFLDRTETETTVSTEAHMFYGYYTIEILKNGSPAGLLSVNGTTGQVLLQVGHGKFIAMQEY